MQRVLHVPIAPGRGYDILTTKNATMVLPQIWQKRWRHAVVIGDHNTDALFAADIAAILDGLADKVLRLRFPAGEEKKTRATKEMLEDAMLAEGVDRFCCIVAVGGGVTLDVAGFLAATYMRGVDHVSIATTLLAQVDAAIGGKTGVNTPHGKNLIGCFHQPRAVVLANDALTSLPKEELVSGLAEAVKHGVLAGSQLLDALERFARSKTPVPPSDLVAQCAEVKVNIVCQDERESGYRQVLNFGHTAGHAMERVLKFRLRHGAAVAAGMVVEAEVARELTGFPEHELQHLRTLLEQLGLPTHPACSFAEAAPHFGVDKKARQGQIRCALPRCFGQMDQGDGRWARDVAMDVFERAWQRCSV